MRRSIHLWFLPILLGGAVIGSWASAPHSQSHQAIRSAPTSTAHTKYAMPTRQGGLPHKYLSLPDLKQNVRGIELARVRYGQGTLPIVVTSESTRITIFVWNPGVLSPSNPTGAPGWISWPRTHLLLSSAESDVMLDHHMPQISTWNWSSRVGVVASGDSVFLVYKRSVQVGNGFRTALYLDQLLWDATAVELRPQNTAPIAIPLPVGYDRFGFYLWAGHVVSVNKLIVVAQAFPSGAGQPQLYMLSADLSVPGVNLSLIGSWAMSPLGEGGYDFDASLAQDELSVLYRREPESLVVPVTMPEDEAVTLSTETTNLAWGTDLSPHKPLFLKTVNVASGAIVRDLRDIPGGEHPQIQSLNPIYLTMDRAKTMSAVFRRFKLTPYSAASYLTCTVRTFNMDKVLMRFDQNRWFFGVLLRVPVESPPRSHSDVPVFQSYFNLYSSPSDTSLAYLGYGSVSPILPVFLVHASEAPQGNEKRLPIDFIYHHAGRRSLLVSRFLIDMYHPLDMRPEEFGFTVYDLNHGQIDTPLSSSQIPQPVGENLQFSPFSSQPENDINSTGVSMFVERAFTYDNTIGGNLIVERRTPPSLRFYAYTDLGDGGARVMFDDTLPPPDPQPQTAKMLSSGALAPPATGESWVKLVQNDDWEQSGLPAYRVDSLFDPGASIGMGLEPQLDMLFGFLSNSYAVGRSVNIREADMLELQSQLHTVFLPWSLPTTSPTNQQPVAQMTYRPSIPFAQTEVAFRIADSGDPTNPIATVIWTFGDSSGTQEGQAAQHKFAEPGTYHVAATVRYSGGQERVVTIQVGVLPSLWTQLWEAVTRLRSEISATEDVKIGDMSISLSKYTLSYEVTDSHDPKSVTITIKGDHDTQVQYTPTSGQGVLRYRFNVVLDSSDITLGGIAGSAFAIGKINVALKYGTSFTPAILTSERRSIDPLSAQWATYETTRTGNTGARWATASTLAMKPIGTSFLEPGRADVEVSATFMGALVEGLLLLGLVTLGLWISGLLAALTAALSSGNLWGILIAIGIAITIAIIVIFVVPAAVERAVEGRLREAMGQANVKTMLDETPILRYAGEGAAEAIALKAIRQSDELECDTPTCDSGRNRFRSQTWQRIYVTQGELWILIRSH